MRDSFVFYRSFDRALKGLSDKDELALLRAIIKYSLYFKKNRLIGEPKRLFELIQPQLDANQKKYENGCKGGGTWGNQNARKRPKNDLKRANENENDNVNDNDKVLKKILELTKD